MHEYPLLNHINSPADLKAVPAGDLPDLCAEVREFLIEHISKTGGHLASNLGVVELTVALHRVFESPADPILFDVGHQCYVHKLFTGRRDGFATLRQHGGISGFLRPRESAHDSFVSGHASNAVSVGLGLARAKRLRGESGRVVCVVGDGALTGGMAYEALNDAGQAGEPLIVLFNDNEMSISRNVGALANRLARIRLKPRYFKMKARAKRFFRRFRGGERIIRLISNLKARLRTALLKESVFEIMGFRYLGPADGHDTGAVESLLREAASLGGPVVVHLKTIKGKGYYPSEKSPGAYHGVSAFDVISGPETPVDDTFSQAFGRTVTALAEADGRVCAITAAMGSNTGLEDFARQFPGRFFDVGIAEGHAVAMAAGLAAGGQRPVCAIYSTFLQRGYDQLIHDVAIGGLPVVLAVDRAGLVGADGATHQGAFDIAYLLSVPGMALYAPSSFAELECALGLALAGESPAAIRYPRGGEGPWRGNTMENAAVLMEDGVDVTVVSLGIMIHEALEGARLLAGGGISAAVVKVNRLDGPVPEAVFRSVGRTGRLIVVEDGIAQGGYGQKVAAALEEADIPARVKLLNLGDGLIPEGKVKELYRDCNIDAQAVLEAGTELHRGR